MTPPLLVFADTYPMATEFAARAGLGPETAGRWRYIRQIEQLAGIDGPGQYVVLTTRHGRPDLTVIDRRNAAIAELKRAGWKRAD